MPINTRDERASAIMVGLPFRAILPEVDGSISEDDRYIVCFLYGWGGIVPFVPTTCDVHLMSAYSRAHHLTLINAAHDLDLGEDRLLSGYSWEHHFTLDNDAQEVECP